MNERMECSNEWFVYAQAKSKCEQVLFRRRRGTRRSEEVKEKKGEIDRRVEERAIYVVL